MVEEARRAIPNVIPIVRGEATNLSPDPEVAEISSCEIPRVKVIPMHARDDYLLLHSVVGLCRGCASANDPARIIAKKIRGLAEQSILLRGNGQLAPLHPKEKRRRERDGGYEEDEETAKGRARSKKGRGRSR